MEKRVKRLENQIAMITGGGPGVGRRPYVREGARVECLSVIELDPRRTIGAGTTKLRPV